MNIFRAIHEIPLDNISIFRSTTEAHLRLLKTLNYPSQDIRAMVESVFTTADCYVRDLVQDSQSLCLKIVSASHSTLKGR